MNRPGAGVVAIPGAAGTLSEAAMARTLGRPLATLTGSPGGARTGSPLAAIPGAIAAEAVALLPRRLRPSASEGR